MEFSVLSALVFRDAGCRVLGVEGAGCWVFRVLGAGSSGCWVLRVQGVKGAGRLEFRVFRVLGVQVVQGAGCLEFRVFVCSVLGVQSAGC